MNNHTTMAMAREARAIRILKQNLERAERLEKKIEPKEFKDPKEKEGKTDERL